MDRQEYLNQISAVNRPAKGSKSGIFSSKFFWIGAIGVAALLLIIIMGAALGGNKGNSPKDKLYSLLAHINGVSEAIGTYQNNVKSSILRADSASLANILSATSGRLNSYVATNYDTEKKDSIPEEIIAEEAVAKEELMNELFEAKINGILDRTYAHKMSYEISLISSSEDQILKTAKDDELIEILTTSRSSLEVLYDNFNEFIEAQ